MSVGGFAKHKIHLVLPLVPCVGVRLVYWSRRSTATFLIYFHWSLLLTFSLHCSSSSAFIRSLFTQSSHLSCGLPRPLTPSCFFVTDLFGNVSSFILTMCPAHFIRRLTICQLYKLYFQLLLAGLSFSVSPLSLLRLFSLSSCSPVNTSMRITIFCVSSVHSSAQAVHVFHIQQRYSIHTIFGLTKCWHTAGN